MSLTYRQTTTIPQTITPSKQFARDEINSDTEAFLRRGGKVHVEPTKPQRPYLETPRKPDPELAARKAKAKPKSPGPAVPRELISHRDAMEICEFDPDSSWQHEKFSAMCDSGEGPVVAQRVNYPRGKVYRYFREADCRFWIAAERLRRGGK